MHITQSYIQSTRTNLRCVRSTRHDASQGGGGEVLAQSRTISPTTCPADVSSTTALRRNSASLWVRRCQCHCHCQCRPHIPSTIRAFFFLRCIVVPWDVEASPWTQLYVRLLQEAGSHVPSSPSRHGHGARRVFSSLHQILTLTLSLKTVTTHKQMPTQMLTQKLAVDGASARILVTIARCQIFSACNSLRSIPLMEQQSVPCQRYTASFR